MPRTQKGIRFNRYWQNYLQKRGVPNAGAVAQWLRVSTVLAEDWSLVLSTHIMWLTTDCLLTPAKEGNPTPLASSDTCTHNTHTLAHSHMCACTLKHKTFKKKSCATNTPIHEPSSREAGVWKEVPHLESLPGTLYRRHTNGYNLTGNVILSNKIKPTFLQHHG